MSKVYVSYNYCDGAYIYHVCDNESDYSLKRFSRLSERDNISITSINFGQAIIPKDDIEELFKLLATMPSLDLIHLGANIVEKDSINELVKTLPNCKVCTNDKVYSKGVHDDFETHNSQNDSGFSSPSNTPERKQSYESMTNQSNSTLQPQKIDPITPEVNEDATNNCLQKDDKLQFIEELNSDGQERKDSLRTTKLVTQSQDDSLTLENNIETIISKQTDSGSQNNCVQKSSGSQFTEGQQLVTAHKETTNRSQTLKQSKDDSFREGQSKNKDKRSYVFTCIAGSGVGLAIAYFVEAAALTSIYVAISVFVGMAFAGALIGYSITKLCENKVETKIESSYVNQHNVQESELKFLVY